MKCPACNHVNPEEANFCSKCAHAISLKCPSCKHTNPGDANYCINCSFDLLKKDVPKKPSSESVQQIKSKLSESGHKLNQAIKDNLSREDVQASSGKFISEFTSKAKRFFCQHEYSGKRDACLKCGKETFRPKKQDQMPERNSTSGLSFGDAVNICYLKFSDFKGKASRSEFWWFYLYSIVIVAIVNFVLGFFGIPLIGGLFALIHIIPVLAVWTRRLHDVNQSGWLLLFWFVPIFGQIILFWFAIKKGVTDPIDNYRDLKKE